ncbi:GreA/GreB family elongation factor [Brevirhabdus sp.]|uniref:GreA/GreB family elongation factor n=1 Tax=Brevirhabdus sp. TaxID=2004514 RepID=UPI004059A4C7
MNKAFTKEDDSGRVEHLPDRPLGRHPNHVTPEGLAALRHRLDDTRAELARLSPEGAPPEVLHAIAVAARDLRWLEARVASAIVVDIRRQPRDRVAFGAWVRLCDENDEERLYRIVGEDEADAAQGLIGLHAPLSRALLGQQVGDVVQWPRPSGTMELEIIAITYDAPQPPSPP